MKQVRKNSLTAIFLLVIIFICGCSKEKYSEETLVKVYVENIIVEETYSANTDSLKAHKDLVLSKYKLTEKEFQNEMNIYAEDQSKWESFFKKANEYLNELKRSNKIN